MTAPALILQGPDAREEFRRWSLAAAIVCAAHLGLMAGYMLMPAAEPDSALQGEDRVVMPARGYLRASASGIRRRPRRVPGRGPRAHESQ